MPDELPRLAPTPEELEAQTKINQQNMAAYFGMAMLAASIVVALLVPHPTPEQFAIFRVVLATASGGFACLLSGTIEVKNSSGANNPGKWEPAIKATGAFAVMCFILWYIPVMGTSKDIQKVGGDVSLDVDKNPRTNAHISIPQEVPSVFHVKGNVHGYGYGSGLYFWLVTEKQLNDGRILLWPKRQVTPDWRGNFSESVQELGNPGEVFSESLYVATFSANQQFETLAELPSDRIVGARRLNFVPGKLKIASMVN